MPRRTLDEGQKPFEYRTGIGLPALGGMFRSGDPVTIPPHKFHTLINMRKTPAGLITRPGLELEYDTGVAECIEGITEDADSHAGMFLYPGAHPRPGNGTEAFNAASFRTVFPGISRDYSEFVIVLAEAAESETWGNPSSVAHYSTNLVGTFQSLSRPFIFRGQAVQFATVDRLGNPTVAILGLSMPTRSHLAAADCWRTTVPGNPACPGLAGTTPPGLNEPPFWPFQHPVGTAEVLVYLENPFTSGAWRPDASNITDDSLDDDSGQVDLILVMPERGDDAISGNPGVGEALYFVAVQDDAGTLKRKLVRWNGVQQTTESVVIPDDLRPGLGEQVYGPFLVSGTDTPGPLDWAAVRGDDGTWATIGGVEIVPAPAEYSEAHFFRRTLSWQGKGQAVMWGLFHDGATLRPFVHVFEQAAADFGGAWGGQSATPREGSSDFNNERPVDVVQLADLVYVLSYNDGLQKWLVCVGSFLQPTTSVALIEIDAVNTLQNNSEVWIQRVGDRVYVGGLFAEDFTSPGIGEHHGVYDVTDYDNPIPIYQVATAEQQQDSGDGHENERLSLGCLPSIPSDYAAGEGFQVS